ncbi:MULTISPECIES: helix-turn-helix domain-containing protein [unclassified Bradyrhizobium]|nr:MULTISPECIES: helix-turn-helix domain-containing protein [unclassified Bradyrhizobium]MBR1304591.1 helix-turn-helix domain-containing protein [Bradyrhizobium sp. U87765 SZCCT0110]
MDSWRAAVSERLVDVACRLPVAAEFDGSFSVFASGGSGLAVLRASRHSASRSRACIDQTGDDFVMLFLQREGLMRVEVEQQQFEVRPGEFFFYDARMPHRLDFDGPFDHIALRMPSRAVEQRWRSLRSRGCFQVCPQEPLSRIAAATLRAAAANIEVMGPDDLAVVVDNVLDLFSAGASKARPDEAVIEGDLVPFARARAVIQAGLTDETLSPDKIARALRISKRSLGKLFERQGISVMEYVVLERLEQAARDLSSPVRRSASVSEIAYRWGFKNNSHFCRRFRQRFGKAPSEMREG